MPFVVHVPKGLYLRLAGGGGTQVGGIIRSVIAPLIKMRKQDASLSMLVGKRLSRKEKVMTGILHKDKMLVSVSARRHYVHVSHTSTHQGHLIDLDVINGLNFSLF